MSAQNYTIAYKYSVSEHKVFNKSVYIKGMGMLGGF